MVQWDCGPPPAIPFAYDGTNTPDVTLDGIAKNGLELAEYLCRELGKTKWAIHMCRCTPNSSPLMLAWAKLQARGRWSTFNMTCCWPGAQGWKADRRQRA